MLSYRNTDDEFLAEQREKVKTIVFIGVPDCIRYLAIIDKMQAEISKQNKPKGLDYYGNRAAAKSKERLLRG